MNNSVLIQSSKFEPSTDAVCDWLYFICISDSLLRINDAYEVQTITLRISNTDNQISLKNESIGFDSKNIKNYWYRRGLFSHQQLIANSMYQKLGIGGVKFFEREIDFLLSAVNSGLKQIHNGINKAQDNYTNKIQNLRFAKIANLNIPDTIVCSDFTTLKAFSKQYSLIITKPINFSSFDFLSSDNKIISIFNSTNLLDIEKVLSAERQLNNKNFLPSLFQQYVEKKFELRIFYLNGQCYSMAIFSQSNAKTKIDFRNYDYERPNRCVPYQLPKEIEQKINAFMHAADLNCGSLDMIYSTDDQYVFLEVNPIGQYQWLTNNCNYFIDRLIAQTLTQ
ncbi:MAG: grasp-with-spasm system ATP-grasp peptide maturase [Chitinophagaceae bacterium]|nr:grasp-with-spasm system ATP-grasp peptide maturase [Chitinophagaceae bacterium]